MKIFKEIYNLGLAILVEGVLKVMVPVLIALYLFSLFAQSHLR